MNHALTSHHFLHTPNHLTKPNTYGHHFRFTPDTIAMDIPIRSKPNIHINPLCSESNEESSPQDQPPPRTIPTRNNPNKTNKPPPKLPPQKLLSSYRLSQHQVPPLNVEMPPLSSTLEQDTNPDHIRRKPAPKSPFTTPQSPKTWLGYSHRSHQDDEDNIRETTQSARDSVDRFKRSPDLIDMWPRMAQGGMGVAMATVVEVDAGDLEGDESETEGDDSEDGGEDSSSESEVESHGEE